MTHQTITLVVLVVATILLLTERLRPDLVALLVLVSLGATDVLTQQEAFSGFSRSAVVTLLAVFILVEGLLRVGVQEPMSALLVRLAGQDEKRMVVTVMLGGAFLSLFMNNIAAASVLLPAVGGAARRSGVSPSRLLMPLAFGTILGGMATLLTTNNLVASSVLHGLRLQGFGLLSFVPLGLPLLASGVLYMSLWGRKLLPAGPSAERQNAMSEAEADLVSMYHLGESLFRARIPHHSTLIGRPLSESGLRERYKLTVIAIERGTERLPAAPDRTMRDGDILVFKGDLKDFKARDTEPYLEILPSPQWTEATLSAPTQVVVEAMLSPRSELIGKTARATHFRTRYGMSVLAIWRKGGQLRVGVRDVELQFGDALLLQGPRSQLPVLKKEKDFIVMADDEESSVSPSAVKSRPLAVCIFAVTFVLAALHQDQVGEVLLGGALVMLMLGILTMDDAYRAIDWRSIFLVAGMLPLGLAMTKTGAAETIATGLVSAFGHFGPLGLLFALALAGMLLTQVMNGAAVTAVIAPIAVQTAMQAGANPRAMVMGVAMATSMAFLTPLGHPVNVLVMGQGGYRFRDYRRVGAGLTALLFIVLLLMLPITWPLRNH